ncbi:digestive cysteine proteinase 2-like [Halichondria panicea]|uniref:digestive cysteine proteinase 2-like n=1 Tax=Halichondria panicea TaxID=6063 RepID=UPI00312B6CED
MFTYDSSVELPNSVDWRTKGYVTRPCPSQNPGYATVSSWAFSVTGSIEGQHCRKTGILISLSEQNLIDCSKDNAGCIGGYEDRAFDFVVKNNGIDTKASYPYTAQEGVCHFNQSHVGANINGYVNITSKDENALQQAVATIGLITATINGSRLSFQLYHSGVYYEPDCSDLGLDRSVLVVGYGSEKGQDYWLVKNSWGTHWGEEGYIKMARNRDNNCGIATQPRYPTV